MDRLSAQDLVDQSIDLMVKIASLKGIPQYKREQMSSHLSDLIEILGEYE